MKEVMACLGILIGGILVVMMWKGIFNSWAQPLRESDETVQVALKSNKCNKAVVDAINTTTVREGYERQFTLIQAEMINTLCGNQTSIDSQRKKEK